jgi:hypothetical protein
MTDDDIRIEVHQIPAVPLTRRAKRRVKKAAAERAALPPETRELLDKAEADKQRASHFGSEDRG